jgi:hypothetical protein
VCQVGHDSSIGLADAGNGMAVMKLKTNLLPFLSVVWLAPSKLLAAGHDCVPVVFYVDSAGKRMRYTVQRALTFMESLQQSVFNLSILRHSGILGVAYVALLNNYLQVSQTGCK